MTETGALPLAATAPRLPAIDVARGVAFALMAVYHLCWDLSFLGLVGFDLLGDPLWLAFRALILSSFLGLVGVSLVLALRHGLAPQGFFRRLAVLVACAAAISGVSSWLFPDSPIFFGVLHCIAVSSVLGLAFARLPVWGIAAAAAACLAAPLLLANPLFDAPWLRWIGLMTYAPRANDYVPLLPWFGVVLLGMALARLGLRRPAVAAAAAWRPRDPAGRALRWAGRHSLVLYMLHQPVLFGLLLLVTVVAGRPLPPLWSAAETPETPETERTAFIESCRARCPGDRHGGGALHRLLRLCPGSDRAVRAMAAGIGQQPAAGGPGGAVRHRPALFGRTSRQSLTRPPPGSARRPAVTAPPCRRAIAPARSAGRPAFRPPRAARHPSDPTGGTPW